MQAWLLILAAPVGLLAGGFATLLVDRVPAKTPLTLRSRCPHCEHALAVSETIPVVSWLVARGRCRHCGDSVTPAYPAVEFVTAGLFVAVAVQFHGLRVLPPLVLVVALVALSTIDLYVYRLPDAVIFPALGLSVVAMVVVAAFGIDRPSALGRAGAGALGYFLLLLIAHLVSPRGIGFGDVKLALLLGLHLGWTAGSTYVGWNPVFRLVFSALILGCLLGVAVGVALFLVRGWRGSGVVPDSEAEAHQLQQVLGSSFPFGPALAVGTMIVVLLPDPFV